MNWSMGDERVRGAIATAVAVYIAFPGDDERAAAEIVTEVGWSRAEAKTFIEANREKLADAAQLVKTQAEQLGGTVLDVARLSGLKQERATELAQRSQAFYKEVTALIPGVLSMDSKALKEAIAVEDILQLFRKHGLGPGPDRVLILSEDAPEWPELPPKDDA